MGAAPFITYSAGADATTAFWTAVTSAQYAYGHDGYTGTIAEKTAFAVVIDHPMTPHAAVAHARTLLDDEDPRFTKRTPAGAIPVIPDTREPGHAPTAAADHADAGRDHQVVGWVFFGEASE
jgi:hypothetical protein